MRKFNKEKAGYIAVIVFIAILLLSISYLRIFDDFEYSTLDFRFKSRVSQRVDKDIVIVRIDDDSIKKLGGWPFLRNYHALLVKVLAANGAKTVVFDVFFSEDKPGDNEFAKAIKNAGIVYLPYIFDLEKKVTGVKGMRVVGFVAPLVDILKKVAKGTGFINIEPDVDGKIRRITPFISYEDNLYPNLTVLAAINDLGYRFDEATIIPGKRIILDKEKFIPLDENSSIMVNYPAKWGKGFRHYSYVEVLESYLSEVTGRTAQIDLSEFKGKVCFVGLAASTARDTNPSPLETFYPGVGVNASVYNSIVQSRFIQRLNKWWNLLILLAMWCAVAYIAGKVRKRFGLISILLVMVVYAGLAMIFFWPFGIWIDVFYPLVSLITVYVIFMFRKYVTEIRKRETIEKELNIAKDIQRSFLPVEIPSLPGMDIAAEMLTAHQVGGDLYDMVRFGKDKIGVMIGDVSGKGVPAALYMARVVSIFKTFAREVSPGEVLKNINDHLVDESGNNLFVTLTYMIFDAKKKTVKYAIGGHPPAIMMDPAGEIKLLQTDEGMPLGLVQGNFTENETSYKPGSVFVLYTDGVTEAMDVKEEMFGQEKLKELVKAHKGCSSKEIISLLQKAISDYAGGAFQHDDITIVTIRV
ncbi:MAG: CHASE2 domain-containing protein [Candidatus Omnitrophica bacterium]|nr:CHASE2 domain-containing protein [Candidatus Omnitrophota bacterium]